MVRFCTYFHSRVLFASSVLNLAELVALRTDLAPLKKLLYFHENQLIYPVRKQQERDFQYGYNQILSWWGSDNLLSTSVQDNRLDKSRNKIGSLGCKAAKRVQWSPVEQFVPQVLGACMYFTHSLLFIPCKNNIRDSILQSVGSLSWHIERLFTKKS